MKFQKIITRDTFFPGLAVQQFFQEGMDKQGMNEFVST